MAEFSVVKAPIRLVKGDITEMETDAIVNTANSTLTDDEVDGAIHRKMESKIKNARGYLPLNDKMVFLLGKTIIASGSKLKDKFVIQTVGPIWHGGKHGEVELLAQTYQNSLKLWLKS